ncbi:prolyl 4-hydroxylase subunit alpha-1-like [Anopheles bellator]|uniref:prolyl 4-hydroxylase subunit alpha-1-like n=1 Tax=Anopheles bellator TaxID=139047 RepID=UPI002647008D|nr:prolyl 4-hydroxylase subunit alpha-1-like [Anopheles bellator]
MDLSSAVGWTWLLLGLFLGQSASQDTAEDGAPTTVKIRFDPYRELCLGTYERPVVITSQLVCWYDARNLHSVIGPYKVELLSSEPFVGIFHDVIHDSEIAKLKELGEPYVKQSGVTNDSWLPVYYDNHQTFTLHDRDHSVVERLTRRIERMTGLSCETAEAMKVIYNEAGAFRTSDIDALRTPEERHKFAYAGDRLATVFFFMSDVEEGGRLIFPRLRVSIRPRKGHAAFWYNLKETGDADDRLRYSMCPLKEDSKWAAKKIIHTRGNELRKPCQPTGNILSLLEAAEQ